MFDAVDEEWKSDLWTSSTSPHRWLLNVLCTAQQLLQCGCKWGCLTWRDADRSWFFAFIVERHCWGSQAVTWKISILRSDVQKVTLCYNWSTLWLIFISTVCVRLHSAWWAFLAHDEDEQFAQDGVCNSGYHLLTWTSMQNRVDVSSWLSVFNICLVYRGIACSSDMFTDLVSQKVAHRDDWRQFGCRSSPNDTIPSWLGIMPGTVSEVTYQSNCCRTWSVVTFNVRPWCLTSV